MGKTRASDCEFSEQGFRVSGGAFDQLEVAYRTIQLETTAIYAGRLVIDIGDGVKLPVAFASVEAEQRSLEAFLGTLTLRSRQQSKIATSDNEPLAPIKPEVFRCRSCGTPVIMDDVPEVVCQSCHQNVAIAEELRTKLRAVRSLEAQQLAVAELVRRALRQPGAKRLNQVLIAVATLGIVWLPVRIVLRALATTLGSVVVLSLAYWLAYVLIASRRALTVLIAEHSARRDQGLYCCCDCGAPLPHAQKDDLIVQCIYCDAQNVLGFDYAGEAAQTAESRRSLIDAYAVHRRALARARVKAIAAVMCTCSAFAWFLRSSTGSDEDSESNGPKFETTCYRGNCQFAGLDGDSKEILAALGEQNTDLVLHVAPHARLNELAHGAALAHIRELYVDEPVAQFDPAVLQSMKVLSILRLEAATITSLQLLAGLPLRSLNLLGSRLSSLEGIRSLSQLESFYCVTVQPRVA